jgi:hypothetical protein
MRMCRGRGSIRGAADYRGSGLAGAANMRGGFFPLLPLLAPLVTGAVTGAGGWGISKLLDKISGKSADIFDDDDIEELLQHAKNEYRPGMTERDLLEMHGSGFKETVWNALKNIGSKLKNAGSTAAKTAFSKDNIANAKSFGERTLKHAGQKALETLVNNGGDEDMEEEEEEEVLAKPAAKKRKAPPRRKPAKRAPISIRRRGGGYSTSNYAPGNQFFQPFTRGPLGAYQY